MPWTENLTSDLQKNVSDMKQAITTAGGTGSKRIIVFFAENKSKAALYEIKYERGACRNDTLQRYTFPETNYTTAEGLASILTNVKALANTPYYSMIIGCHGTGWMPVGGRLKANRRHSFGTGSGGNTAYQTEIATLAAAIRQADMPMEFILFDDCYMAGVEVAYELHEATHYLIASTCEMMDKGIPYDLCGTALLSHDYKAACDNFYNFYSNYSYPYATLSVIDCSKLDEMASMMRHINATYELDLSKINQIQILDGCSSPIFFDMGSYIEQLLKDHNASLYQELTMLLKEVVPTTVHTENYISFLLSKSGSIYPINTYSGITISDPSTNEEAIISKTKTRWWKASH